MPRMCGVFGARAPGGNTQDLLDLVLQAASRRDVETEQHSLVERPVLPIGDCRRCDRYHGCQLADAGPPLLDRILEADVIVLASPIYWSGPSAQLKAFIDRWSCVPDAEMKRRMAGKRLVGLTAYGQPDPESAEPFRRILQNLAHYFSLPQEEFLAVFCARHGDATRHEVQTLAEQLVSRVLAA